ncbi:MAG: hypothetical protein JNK76_01460 [Planctomycetales bacterium]|nr:hypothetical protein [Planctomycetales bacterium]MBN8625893.1 hypothetical protein [Planctomycetota bacterium]
MTLRRIISTALVFSLGFVPASAEAGKFTDLGKAVVSKAVNKGVSVAWDADTVMRQKMQDPNSLTGKVLRKTAGVGHEVAGQIRQQINTPQQTPITKILGAGKAVANKVLDGDQAGAANIVQVGGVQGGGAQQLNNLVKVIGNKGVNPNVPIIVNAGQANNQNDIGKEILKSVIKGVVNQAINNVGNGGFQGGFDGGIQQTGGFNSGSSGQVFPSQLQQTASIDLELHDLKLVDRGDETMGPAYRLSVRNNSQRGTLGSMIAVLMASQDAQPTADSPYATFEVPTLAAGQMTTVDIRLPQIVSAESDAFSYLTAAVGTPAGFTDTDESNNMAAFDRSSVSSIPAKITGVSVDETAGRMILEGEGFGSDFGKLFLTVDGRRYEATVSAWGPTMVYFTVDGFDGNGANGSFTLVRNDGRLAPALDIALAQ